MLNQLSANIQHFGLILNTIFLRLNSCCLSRIGYLCGNINHKFQSMKKSIFYTSFAVLSLVFVLASCNKYEEGANFSLLSAKARLVNTWHLDKVTVSSGGFSSESTDNNVTMEIKKDETYSSSGTYFGFAYTITGTWAFNSDKTQVIFTDSDGDVSTATIIKLKNKELVLEGVDGNTTTRSEYSAN